MPDATAAHAVPPDLRDRAATHHDIAVTSAHDILNAALRGEAPHADDAPRTIVAHRAMHDAARAHADADAARRLKALARLDARGLLLDPLKRVLPFGDRAALADLVVAAGYGHLLPECVLVESEADDAADAAARAGLRYPLLCKPRVACGTAASHELAIAFSADGVRRLRSLRPPLLLQRYVPHGARVLKVYSAGGVVHQLERPSLPDLGVATASAGGGVAPPDVVSFSSQGAPPGADAFGAHACAHATQCGAAAWEAARARTAEAAPRLASRLGVSLLGLDFVVCAERGREFLIDLNYWPATCLSFDGAAAAFAAVVRRECGHHEAVPFRSGA